ncbi:MAG: rod-binding protein [Treponema sp.]|jgi:flagellar protein FlgJ|nr:rod-binding protein [Treponema sp.]
MAIESTGSLHLDQARLGQVSSSIGRANTEELGKTGPSFADILDNIESAEQKVRQGPKKPVIDKTDKLYEQCEALETFLIKNLLNGMRNTVEKSGFIDEGFAGKMYEDMLYDEYAKEYTKNAHFGLTELAYLELTGQRGK